MSNTDVVDNGAVDQTTATDYDLADSLLKNVGPDGELTPKPNPAAVTASNELADSLQTYDDLASAAQSEQDWAVVDLALDVHRENAQDEAATVQALAQDIHGSASDVQHLEHDVEISLNRDDPIVDQPVTPEA